MAFGKFVTIDLETGKKILKTLEASLVSYDGSKSVKDVIIEEIARATGVEGELRQLITQEVERAESAEAAIKALIGEIGETNVKAELDRITGLISTLESKVDNHIGDAVKHITGEERTKWNKVIGDLTQEVSDRKAEDLKLQNQINVKADKSFVDQELAKKANTADLGTAAFKNVGVANGNIVEVGEDGKINKSVLPSIAINETQVVNSVDAAMLLSIQNGDVVIINPAIPAVHEELIEATTISGTFICVDAAAETFEARFRELYSSSDSISKAEVTKLIGDETSARTSADSDLDGKITQEISARTSADSSLQEALDSEVSRAKVEEVRLDTAIKAEVKRATAKEEEIDGKVTQEIADRKSEIIRVEGLVETEKNRAIAEEGKLDKAIKAEVQRAQGIEGGLQSAIDAINNVETGILKQAKDYANAEDVKIGTRITEIEKEGGTIDQKVEAEATLRIAGDSKLQGEIEKVPGLISAAVAVETGAREEADTALGLRLTAAEGTLGNAESGLVKKVNDTETLVATINGNDATNGSFRKAVKDLETSVTSANAGITGRLDVIEGTEAGSIKKALADAKAYTDALDSKIHATGEEVDSLAQKIATEQAARVQDVSTLTSRIEKEENTSKANDLQHSNRLDVIEGEGPGSIKKALVDAKAYTDGKIGEVNQANSTLAGRVEVNEQAIATLKGDDSTTGSVAKTVKDAVAVETSARTEADLALSNRITPFEGDENKEGSVANQVKVALEAAKSHANGLDTQVRVDYKAADVVVEGKITAENRRAVAEEQRLAGLISDNTQAISTETSAREEADNAIIARIGVLEASEAVVVKYPAGEVIVGDLVKVVDGTVQKASQTDEYIIGVVVTVGEGTAKVAIMGKIKTTGLTAGKTYFLGDNGALTNVMPTAVGKHIVVVGKAMTATDLFLRIEEGILIKE